MTTTTSPRAAWMVILTGAAFLMVTMGMRQSLGLFVSPLNTSTGLGIAAISFALAISQFIWGAVQPIAGAFADRYGTGRVLAAGILILALGTAITPLMTTTMGLIFAIGFLQAGGSGAGSFSVLIAAAAQRLPAERRGFASGVINAGGSFGQFVFAPLAQRLISGLGWMGALWSMAVIVLAALAAAAAVVMRVVPDAVRLGTRVDSPARQSALARSICRDHLLCFASLVAFLLLRAGAAWGRGVASTP